MNCIWICYSCSLPFRSENCLSDEICELSDVRENSQTNIAAIKAEATYTNLVEDEHIDMQDLQKHSILEQRKNNSSRVFIMHLNINSLQNKFDELKLLNKTLKAHILDISETKIDTSYPNSQFTIPGYNMYRKDRKKGGGGLIAYFSSTLFSRKIGLPKTYNTLEAVAVESRIGTY